MDAYEILKIPRLGCGDHNSVVWNFEDNGVFTVKIAYKLAMLLKDSVETSSSSSMATNPSFWSKLWKVNLLNKIKKNCGGCFKISFLRNQI